MRTKIAFITISYFLFSFLLIYSPGFSKTFVLDIRNDISEAGASVDDTTEPGSAFEDLMKDPDYWLSWSAVDNEEDMPVSSWMIDPDYWLSWSAVDNEEDMPVSSWMIDPDYWLSWSAVANEEDIPVSSWMIDPDYWLSWSAVANEEDIPVSSWMSDANYWNFAAPFCYHLEIADEINPGIEGWMTDPCRWDTGNLVKAGHYTFNNEIRLCMNEKQKICMNEMQNSFAAPAEGS